MQFIIDESTSAAVVAYLRGNGHDVLAVAEIMLETLESLNMKFPKPKIDPTKVNLR